MNLFLGRLDQITTEETDWGIFTQLIFVGIDSKLQFKILKNWKFITEPRVGKVYTVELHPTNKHNTVSGTIINVDNSESTNVDWNSLIMQDLD